MSDTQERPGYTTEEPYAVGRRPEPTAWVGFVVFGGIMMLILGGFQAIEGFVAILKDEYYLVTRNGLLLSIDYTTWGWIHLLIGVIAVAAGFGVLLGQTWARVLGII